MRTDASVKFKQLLNKYNLYNDFRSRIKHLGMKYEAYVTYVEAIYAFRRIINLYDDSEYSKAAVEWEDIVVLNHFSKTIEPYIKDHGMQTVIKVIHELQRQNKWEVPVGISKLQSFNDKVKMKESLNDAVPATIPAPVSGGVSTTPTDHVDSSTSAVTPQPANPMTPANTHVSASAPSASLPSDFGHVTPPSFSTFDSDDGRFDILDLAGSVRNTRAIIDNYHIQVTTNTGNYRVRFNQHIVELARKYDAVYLHLRTDKMLGKTFLVLTTNEVPGSIPCKWSDDKVRNNLHVNSKMLTTFLAKGRTETKFQRHVSTNLSQLKDTFCFELFDD